MKNFDPTTPTSSVVTASLVEPPPKANVVWRIGGLPLRIWNGVGLTTVPPGVVTLIVPEFAPSGTVATSRTSDRTSNLATCPPTTTWVAPARLIPEISTVAFRTAPGVLNEMVGGPDGVTVNVPAVAAEPAGPNTSIGCPDWAPAGTRRRIRVSPSTSKSVAGIPPTTTLLTPKNPDPVNWTVV